MVTIYIVLLAVSVLAVVWGICHYFDSSTKETHVLYSGPKKSANVNESSSSSNDFLYVAAAIEVADTTSDFFDFD